MAICSNILESGSGCLCASGATSLFLSSIRGDARNYTRNRYFVWRHGESRANRERIIISSLKNGRDAFGLTPRGIMQVRREVKRVGNILGSDILIISSPFLRCIETAQVIAEELGVPAVVSARELRERGFGAFERKTSRSYRRVYARDQLLPHSPAHGVEPVSSVRSRALALIRTIEEAHAGKTVLLITHADVGEILQTAYSGFAAHEHRKLSKLVNGECRELYVR